MTHLDRRWFSAFGKLVAIAPWPGSAAFVALILVGLALSPFPPMLEWMTLSPEDVIGGQWWRLLTGQFVQPPRVTIALVAAVVAAVYGREVEQRSGGWKLWRFALLATLVTSGGWVAVQSAARYAGLQSGWEVSFISCPVVTALVSWRLVSSPYSRLAATGYALSTWAGASGHVAATCILLAWEPWPVLLPAHLIGLVFGSGWGYADQRTWNAYLRQFQSIPPMRPIVPRHESHSPEALRASVDPSRSEDDDLDLALDRVLAKVAVRGQDALSAADRAILMEASERFRRRRKG